MQPTYTLHRRVHNICNFLLLLLLLVLNLILKPSGNSNFHFLRGCYPTLGYSPNCITPRDSGGGTLSRLPATSSYSDSEVRRRQESKHTSNFTSSIYCTTTITLCRWHTKSMFPFQQIADSQTTTLTSDLMSSVHLFLSLQSGHYPTEFSTKIVHAFISSLSPIYISISQHPSDFATKISRYTSLISQILHLFQTFLGPNAFLGT